MSKERLSRLQKCILMTLLDHDDRPYLSKSLIYRNYYGAKNQELKKLRSAWPAVYSSLNQLIKKGLIKNSWRNYFGPLTEAGREKALKLK